MARTVSPGEAEAQAWEGRIHVMEQDARWLIDPEGSGTHWMKVQVLPHSAESLDEEGPKRTFDFPGEDGAQVDRLDEFAETLGASPQSAASNVINYPFPSALPKRLSHEAWQVASGALPDDA